MKELYDSFENDDHSERIEIYVHRDPWAFMSILSYLKQKRKGCFNLPKYDSKREMKTFIDEIDYWKIEHGPTDDTRFYFNN